MVSTKCSIEDALLKTVATGMFENMLCEKPDLDQLTAKTGAGSGKSYGNGGGGKGAGKDKGEAYLDCKWRDCPPEPPGSDMLIHSCVLISGLSAGDTEVAATARVTAMAVGERRPGGHGVRITAGTLMARSTEMAGGRMGARAGNASRAMTAPRR